MRAADTTAGLIRFTSRGAGTDAERRAARWLAEQLRQPGRQTRIETFWCRPNWALAHGWHLLLAIAGSLLSVSSPRLGGILVLAALLFTIADERLGVSPGRRLTPERASQNVVSVPGRAPEQTQVHLIITANYDAGRTGFAYRLRSPFQRLNMALGGRAPGWLGWLSIAMGWLIATSVLRLEGAHGTAVGIAQLIPTATLVTAFALLLELATARFGPAASDNASGVAIAIALVTALGTAPPRNATVELVLQGAGDGFGIGLGRHLRVRRGELKAPNTVVLGIAAAGSGQPAWWISDGQLIPLRYLSRLAHLCKEIAQAGSNTTPMRGRGATPAFPARSARLPAIAIGASAPRSHRQHDTPDTLDQRTLDHTLQFGLLLVDAIDGFLGVRGRHSDRTRTSHRRHRISLRRPLSVLARSEREPPDQLGT